MLNAKHHEKEALIVAQAGKKGAVTIATNMAGRGTDIILGGNPDFSARGDMSREGFTDELIEQSVGTRGDRRRRNSCREGALCPAAGYV